MEGMYEGFGAPISVPQAPKKGGMFGAGKANIGEAIAAALAGFTAARGNPAGAFALQMLNQRRQSRDEQAQYNQQREDKFQDWVRQQAYQQEHPGAPDPTAFQKDYAWYLQNNPELAKQFATAHAATGGSPFGSMFTDPATGQHYAMGGSGQPQAGPQPGQVEDGFQFMGGDPSDQKNWKPAGGPTPQASGGFPRSY